MSPRRSLRTPITLAVVMMGLLCVLTVGWIILSEFGAEQDQEAADLQSAFLAVGTSFLGLLIAGVVTYMVLTIKAINLGRRQSNFIDSVTHELKSPIASMKLYLQTLRRQQVTAESRDEFYELMLEDVDRLDHLINQMLDAGRLEAGRQEGELSDVSIPEVLREGAEITCARHRADPEIIRLDLAPCGVRARRTDLMLIFRNLLDNAVKYAGTPPLVEVRAATDPRGRAVVSVADNGPGIPIRMRRRVFSRFVRLGSELEREQPGTGLGLYVARTIVRKLGGRIRVRDRQRGPGSVFEVVLPGTPSPEAREPAGRSAPEEKRAGPDRVMS